MSLLVKAPKMSREHDKFTRLRVRFNAPLYTGFTPHPPHPQKKEALEVIVKIFLFDMKRWENFEGKNNTF